METKWDIAINHQISWNFKAFSAFQFSIVNVFFLFEKRIWWAINKYFFPLNYLWFLPFLLLQVLTEYILVSVTSAVTVTIAGVVKEAVTILV